MRSFANVSWTSLDYSAKDPTEKSFKLDFFSDILLKKVLFYPFFVKLSSDHHTSPNLFLSLKVVPGRGINFAKDLE